MNFSLMTLQYTVAYLLKYLDYLEISRSIWKAQALFPYFPSTLLLASLLADTAEFFSNIQLIKHRTNCYWCPLSLYCLWSFRLSGVSNVNRFTRILKTLLTSNFSQSLVKTCQNCNLILKTCFCPGSSSAISLKPSPSLPPHFDASLINVTVCISGLLLRAGRVASNKLRPLVNANYSLEPHLSHFTIV